jgi:hypothetical protein
MPRARKGTGAGDRGRKSGALRGFRRLIRKSIITGALIDQSIRCRIQAAARFDGFLVRTATPYALRFTAETRGRNITAEQISR